jgi:histidyl-tRNA synthetase
MEKQANIKPERPGGFLDFLTSDYLAREKMLRTIEKVFRSFGFDPIETPRVEFLKTLSGEESDAGKNIFILQSRDDNEALALPFDHTVPFARVLAANPYEKGKGGIKLPWKRMAVGPVFRRETPQSGRYRQFYQFDADIAGTSSMMADAEIISLMHRTLEALGVENYEIRINNRKILNGLADLAGIESRSMVSREEIVKEMMRILDKVEKIGSEEVIVRLQNPPENEYSLNPNLDDDTVGKIKQYLQLKGGNRELLSRCQEIFKNVTIAEEGIKELEVILDHLEAMNIPEKFVRVDFSIARGLDYYTGPVMETSLLNAPQFGSVFSGGRFNDLVARFTGNELPAVGASIGVDRLFAALDYLNLLNKENTTVSDVMILRLMPDKEKEYLQIAQKIRSLGLNAEVSFLEDTTFKTQFNYGISRGVKFLVLQGENEHQKGVVQVKNLQTRQQEEVKTEEIKKYFQNLV